MHTIQSLTLKICSVVILILSTVSPSIAQDFNNQIFSGTVNTTVSSGLTIRMERDCSNLDGYSFTGPVGTYIDGSGEGCATTLTDAYGNTTTKALSRSSGTNDDGSMNFDEGSIVTATQKFYTEVLGKTSGGIGVNLSFTGFIDPALTLNEPTYAPLTSAAKNEFERGFDLLNAYAYGSIDTAGGGYVDWTIGRQVTNWGEATFIPIGMNGFTTNALDLTKLRGPGSTIREALIPTNQISISAPLSNGISLEAFYQLEHRAIELDPAGSFYGSEIVGNGSTKMITSGMYNKENKYFDDCNYTKVGSDTTACTDGVIREANTTTGDQTYGTTYLLTKGLQATADGEVRAGQAFAAAKTFGSGTLATAAGAAWTDAYTATLNTYLGSTNASGVAAGGAALVGDGSGGVNKTFYTTNTTAYNLLTGAHVVKNSYNEDRSGNALLAALTALDTDVSDDSINTIAAVSIRRSDDFIKEARSDGQFGLRLSGFSDVGTGIDWSLNYSRFHSKTPYLRVKGQAGIYAGDLYGIISTAGDTAQSDRTTAQANLVSAIENVQYSAGICNAALSAGLAKATFSAYDPTGTYWTAAQALARNYNGTAGNYGGATSAQKALVDQFTWQDNIAGYGTVHNAAKCKATADAFTTQKTNAFNAGDDDVQVNVNNSMYDTAEVLLSAITPLNLARYELIFPEDLDAIGLSFNTNYAGTAIQGEVTYRPEFPLAHNAGDQVSQIGDVSGAYDLLDMFAFNTLASGIINNTNDDGTDQNTIVYGAKISTEFYNDDTSDMTAAQIFQQGARMNMIGLATWSGTSWTIVDNNGSETGYDLNVGGTKLNHYKNWMASTSSGTTKYLGLAGVKAGVFNAAYVTVCTAALGGSAANATTCGGHTLGAGNYTAGYYTGAYAASVGGAYEYGTIAFNRSSLPALLKANTTSAYYSTPFVKKDVWSYDIATTTTFSASHPITSMLGADSAAFLTEFGAVAIAGMDNAKDGYIARNGYQEGIGQEKCNGPFGALVAGGLSFGGAAGGITHLGAGQVDALFGNGGYCEDQNGADDFSMSYRMIGTATYNNFNNSGWSVTPSVVWAHDPYGYGPSSLGGFVEDKMTMSLSLNVKKGSAINMGLNYTSHLEGPEVSASSDRDTLTASMSYSF
jgi:hypothetical protein